MASTYLASKPRYEILDGLRGVAAMTVVAFHLFETYSKGPDFQIVNHGYLAVDFFFVLSGFVIGYAYDDRWDRMSLGKFFKRRLIRLHPLVILGAVIGVLLFYFGDGPMFQLVGQTPWWKLLLIMLLAFTMIPARPSWDIRGWSETYPLNGVTWSLMWEYIANILYALFIRHFSKTLLIIFVCLSAFFTLDIALDWDVFGVLEGRSYAANTMIGGWSLNAEQGYIGLTRLLYPFFCGLLISRIGKFITLRGGFWICALAVAVLLCMPCIPGGVKGTASCFNGIYNALCVLVIFPLIVMVGAGSKCTDGKSTAVCNFLGRISYPLYITHYPLIYIQMKWTYTHIDAPVSHHIFVGVCIFILAIAISYAALRLFDEPVRRWLREKIG